MRSPHLERIVSLVRDRAGLVFPENRAVIVEAGVRRAMAAAKMTDVALYTVALEGSDVLLDDLFAELTVGETYFFREPAQLQYIQHEVLPRFRQLNRGVRAWSAGCATGEEPYTISMMLHDAELSRDANILGTDLSRARLRLAQRGTYRQWSMRGVPEQAVERHFTVRNGTYQLAPSVVAPVEFRYLNLIADKFPSPALGVWGVDLILCRNVLIYFDEPSIACVAAKLLDTLTDDGWLFLGASDPILSEIIPCEVVITSAGLAYKRRGAVQSAAAPTSARSPWPDTMFDDPDPIAEIVGETTVTPDATNDVVTPEPAVSAPLEFPPPPSYDDAVPSALSESAWIDRVRTLANLGRLREAGDACASALDRYRTSAELTYLHTILLSEAGRHADAATAARQALYLDRTMIVAHLALGSALRRTGDMTGAHRAFANAVALLDAMPSDAVVPASGGESVGRLSAAARVQLTLAEAAA
ncbi:MAG TPA: protein-glutamate O-methyltransferase CheR [Gemmatimonadaceae bacterium]|jgi:chemotaxis protein methyltransferase CheR|nr:protein-glutamate O-methyltransferase CheR [Gemmatimonadaceae bacterium]